MPSEPVNFAKHGIQDVVLSPVPIEMLFDEIFRNLNVVANENNDLTGRNPDAVVSCRRRTAVLLPNEPNRQRI